MITLEQKAEDVAQSIIDQNPSLKDAYNQLVSTYLRGWHDCYSAMLIQEEKRLRKLPK